MRISLILTIALAVLAPRAWSQCSEGAGTVNYADGFIRENGNELYYYAEGWVTDAGDSWDTYVDAAVNQSESGIFTDSDDESLDALVPWDGDLEAVSAGTFTEYAEWDFTDLDDSSCDAEYDDDSQEKVIRTPSISGLFSSNAFWNLGPGSADPTSSTDMRKYYQSVALTFNTNCDPGDDCSDTPQWSLYTSSNQTTLGTEGASPVTTASGSTATISKSSSYGNCAYDSDLQASLDGFYSPVYEIAVDSPKCLSHTTEETAAYYDGYLTYWRFEVVDACGYNYLIPVQMSEQFPSGFSADNGSSNYATPGVVNFELDDWPDDYEFIDNIGQCCNGQSPSVYYDDSGPPYSGNTRYYYGAHTINAGTDDSGYGVPVYPSGTIQYYADHGNNTP